MNRVVRVVRGGGNERVVGEPGGKMNRWWSEKFPPALV